ncbi:MAG: hypothetical protein QM655_04415 [Nocardioidaceae bacterium]
MSDLSWYALGLSLTVAGLVWSYVRFQRNGPAVGVRTAAWALLPAAAALTGLLELGGDIASSVGDWMAHLVFSPAVWLGAGVAGLAVVLFVVSGWMRGRGAPAVEGKPAPKAVGGKSAASAGSEFDDIEAILRKHGIS